MQNHRIPCILDRSLQGQWGMSVKDSLLQETPGPPWRQSGFIFLSAPIKELNWHQQAAFLLLGHTALGTLMNSYSNPS